MSTFKKWLELQEAFDPHEDDAEDKLSYANKKANRPEKGRAWNQSTDDDDLDDDDENQDDDFDIASRSIHKPIVKPPVVKTPVAKPVFDKQGPLNRFISARNSVAPNEKAL